MNEDVTRLTPLVEVIVYSKLSTFIINQSQYKFLKFTFSFLSQLLAARTVVDETVTTVSKDKSWTAIGLYGKKRKHDEKAVGCIRLFGGNNDWKVDIAGLAEKNTMFAIDCLFSEVKKHVPGGNNLSVEFVSLIVDKHVGLEVPHYDK